jgi:hypothetical protein
MESFFETMVSLSSERAHRLGSSLEETSSDDEEESVDEEESLSSSLSSPLVLCFFDVVMDSSSTR